MLRLTKRSLQKAMLYTQQRRTMWVEAAFAAAAIGVPAVISSLKVVRPYQRGLVEVFGKYTHTADPGLRAIWPFGIGKITMMPTDMQRVEIPGQSIITKEQLNATVHALVYFQVVDPFKARYNVDNFETTVPSLAQTTLRNVLGTFNLAEANSQRKEINDRLKEELESQIHEWGMRVVSVELQQIEPTDRVQKSMNDIVVAEQQMIASTNLANAEEIKADGIKRASVKEAEGKATALRLNADAKAYTVRVAADADAAAIAVKYQAVQDNFHGNVVDYQRLMTTETSLKHNSTILLPQDGRTINLIDVAKLTAEE